MKKLIIVWAFVYSLVTVPIAVAEDASVERDMEEEVVLYETFDMGSFPGGDHLPPNWGEYVHGPRIYVYGGYFGWHDEYALCQGNYANYDSNDGWIHADCGGDGMMGIRAEAESMGSLEQGYANLYTPMMDLRRFRGAKINFDHDYHVTGGDYEDDEYGRVTLWEVEDDYDDGSNGRREARIWTSGISDGSGWDDIPDRYIAKGYMTAKTRIRWKAYVKADNGWWDPIFDLGTKTGYARYFLDNVKITGLNEKADLLVKIGEQYIGDGIFSEDGQDQTKYEMITRAGATVSYYVRLENQFRERIQIPVRGSRYWGSAEEYDNWTVTYYEFADGSWVEITTDFGMESYWAWVDAWDFKDFCIDVTLNEGADVEVGESFWVKFQAESWSRVKDVAKLVTEKKGLPTAPPPEDPPAIPALSRWGLISMSVFLAASAIWLMRRRKKDV